MQSTYREVKVFIGFISIHSPLLVTQSLAFIEHFGHKSKVEVFAVHILLGG
jgi:hypothetical protein